jgi:folate-binding protein YgfZ
MSALALHSFHAARGASFSELNGSELVPSYGSTEAEYLALARAAVLADLSFRGRMCVLGTDREKFVHGQVTNDVAGLKTGEGCYAALINAKGKIQSDLFIYKLRDELLLDFEPGLTKVISDRLEKYIIADDVQLVDIAALYGLISAQGPKAAEVLKQAGLPIPEGELHWSAVAEENGEIYVMRNSRFGFGGFDIFVPVPSLEQLAIQLESALKDISGRWAGFSALEIARIENGIPRFGADMNESNLAPEAEIQDRAISYAKGCYIGQEIIARLRTYGQTTKSLRLLRLPSEGNTLPDPGTKLFKSGKEIGYITSSTLSPKHGAKIALGYVRKETNAPGEKLSLGTPESAEEVLILGKAGAASA